MDSNSGNSHKHGSEHSGRHSSGRSSHRHHRHSSEGHKTSSKPYRYEKRPRLEDNPKREKAQKIESFFYKNILTFFGIIFIGGAIWLGSDNWHSIENYISASIEKSKTVEFSLNSRAGLLVTSVFTSSQLQPTKNFHDTSLVLLLGFAMVFILSSLGLSIHRKNLLLKTISFGGWVIITMWLLVRFIITMYSVLFFGIIILSTLFFGLFFISGFVDTYVSRSRWKRILEFWLILLNSLFYFITILVVLNKSGQRVFEPVFTFLLAALYLIAFYNTDKKNITYNKIPYLLSALIILCSFLPMVLKVSPWILFLSPLSVFLVLFSRYSRNQSPVLVSLLAMIVMGVIYIFQWSNEFLPAITSDEGVPGGKIFFKGLVSSLFFLLALAVNNIYLRKLAVSFGPKWIRKLNPLKVLKAMLLAVIYLSGYWIFNYLVVMIPGHIRVNLITWFIYNCMYFIFYIPHLAWQRSSFFRVVVIAAIVSSLASFTFVHLSVLHIRAQYLETPGSSILPFLIHYVCIGFLIGMLFSLLHYFKRAFPGKKTLIKGFWIYFYLISTFLLLAEFDHIAVVYQHSKGMMENATIFNTQKLPYSFLLILSAATLLWVGFSIKSRFLRIASLFVIGVVLIKILSYDVITLNPQSKIILLFILGVSLLGVSVSYPKIKRSFFEKDSPVSHEEFSVKRKHKR